MNECQLCDHCRFLEDNKKIFYETHVTVGYKDSFYDDCYSLGIKPILIDMGEDIPRHAMTSTSVEGGSREDAVKSAHFIANALEAKGYEIQRVKVETVPWHPEATNPASHQYFETHIPINLPCDTNYLDQIAKFLHLHKSRNLFKRGGKNVQMLTYRDNGVSTEKFLNKVELLKKILTSNGFTFDKVITEFAFYDTNVEMDQAWLSSSQYPKYKAM